MIGVVIGNYQIVQKLGEGGMGVVYLGQHTLLGRRAAIKVLLPELSARQDVVNRFFNEARAVTTISDPGIVQVFDFGYHTDGSAYIVMEFLDGEPLDRRLARLGRLPAAEALRMCRQIASSLAAAHAQGIVHRDLKPENIYLVPDGEVSSGERSKILDFGIAKLSDNNPGKVKTHTGALMGTPIYMSPEQCRGLSELDHRSDIYALGCVLFHLLTGRPPFEGEGMGDIIAAHIREPAQAPSSRVSDIAPRVDALVLRCLAKAPADRYQTMTELAVAIGQILPYITSPESPTQWVYAYQGGPTPPPAYASAPMPQAPALTPYPSAPPMPTPSPPVPTPYPRSPTPPPPAASNPHLAAPYAPTTTPYGARAATPVPPAPVMRSPTPTTLGSSVGQVNPTEPPRARKLGMWIASLAVIAVAGGGVAFVALRERTIQPVASPPAPDAALAVPQATVDAGVPVDASPDAAPPDAPPPPPPPVDAAPPPPVDAAPPRRHRTPHSTAPRTGSGSGSASTPPGCDRTIDTDCDGIPDVR